MPDEADAGAEVPGTSANAEEAKGNEVTCPQTTSEFLALLEDFEKRQAHGTKPTSGAMHVMGQTVEPMLPTTAAATKPQCQFRMSKRMCNLLVNARASGRPAGVERQNDPVLGSGKMVPARTPLPQPTMEEIRACRTYGPQKQNPEVPGGAHVLARNPTPSASPAAPL